MSGKPDINGATRVAAVVGYPIGHSLSPAIHNAWLRAAGIDAVYLAFAPEPDRFGTFIDGVRHSGMLGLNVTLPFKERALTVADTVDPSAKAAGAANLLLFGANGRIEARNTDGIGLLAAFREQAPCWSPDAAPTVILGAGGAGRGAAAALVAAGAHIRIVNRTAGRAHALAADFARAQAFDADALQDALRGAGALVNAAPAGSYDLAAIASALSFMAPNAVVMDMTYTPVRTPLLLLASARGLSTVDGLAMLIGQARPSFTALFGGEPPATTDVRAVALRYLGEPQ